MEDSNKSIFLYADDIEELYLNLIKKDDAGALYQVQCGGLACNHHFVRGNRIILFGPFWWNILRKLEGYCEANYYLTKIVQQEADEIDRILSRARIKMDRDSRYILNISRSAKHLSSSTGLQNPSCEAFFHVVLEDGAKAVLTWANSD